MNFRAHPKYLVPLETPVNHRLGHSVILEEGPEPNIRQHQSSGNKLLEEVRDHAFLCCRLRQLQTQPKQQRDNDDDDGDDDDDSFCSSSSTATAALANDAPTSTPTATPLLVLLAVNPCKQPCEKTFKP